MAGMLTVLRAGRMPAIAARRGARAAGPPRPSRNDREHLVARPHDGRRLHELGLPLAEHGDETRARRKREPAGLLAGRRRATLDLYLDDDEPLLLQLEQSHEAVLGHLVLDEPEDARRRAERLRDPEQVEVLLVARVVHARDRLAHAVALLRDLRDDEVVLVVARHREQELGRTCDSGALEHCDLGRVAADHGRVRTPPRVARTDPGRCSISVTS